MKDGERWATGNGGIVISEKMTARLLFNCQNCKNEKEDV